MNILSDDLIYNIYTFCDIDTKIKLFDFVNGDNSISDYVNELKLRCKIAESNINVIEHLYINSADAYWDQMEINELLINRIDCCLHRHEKLVNRFKGLDVYDILK